MLPADAAVIVAELLREDRRVMLFGAPGSGKSTLATQLADVLLADGRSCLCIGADPGSPAFGVPGALALGRRGPGDWETVALEPLCSLDAGRFRLPLTAAVRRLAAGVEAGMLLLDSPGVVRGMAGSELLHALVDVAAVDLVLVLAPAGRPLPLANEFAALPVAYHRIDAAPAARRPGKRARARSRTLQWDAHLSQGRLQEVGLDRLTVVGTPPPLDEPGSWVGRQVALMRRGNCLAMGEVAGLDFNRLRLRGSATASDADTLLVRDALRGTAGLLESAVPFAAAPSGYLPPADLLSGTPSDQGPRAVGRVGGVDVALVNGLFGDPLLHLRFRHCARSLLIDLGDGSRLSARVAHQVSDIFISHAHMDHLGGFLWLLRSRIGDLPPCRLYGPPGLAGHVRGLIEGFLWDRVGDRGAAFEVAELHGERLHCFGLRAGRDGVETLPSRDIADGVLHREPGFQVRAVTLDHHTPVLAYAFEPDRELNVRRDRLQALGLSPGPWLNELKRRFATGETDGQLRLPDGSAAGVAELVQELLTITPGRRLVYATDLADTPDNRERLAGLARHAHTLFLEAVFTEADVVHARTHGHLTARACGEIANAAGVSRLVPFHLSRRYLDDPQRVFDELEAACGCVARPGKQLLPATVEASGHVEFAGD